MGESDNDNGGGGAAATAAAPIAEQPKSETDFLVGQPIGKFVIGQYVTGGSFGSFHLGAEARSGRRVGIKLEKRDVPTPQLVLEVGFYRALGAVRFIPKILHFGPCGAGRVWHGMVMELLGPSLRGINEKCGGTFGILTTVQLTIQLLNMFEYVHEHAIIYRDIKPENFLLGCANSSKWCTVCLIDLGFCKRYLDEQNKHMEFQKGKPITGTARYMSVNNHAGCELSRRDDIEAIMYMIIFLHKGHLPWQGITAATIKERYRQMRAIKMQASVTELCSNMPPTFADLLSHAKRLRFDQSPQYGYFIAEMHRILLQMGTCMEEQIYDWDTAHNPKNLNNSSSAITSANV